MTGDNNKFLLLKEKDIVNNVNFGNNAPTTIKGKAIVSLDEKTKAQNVLYVEGLKHNFLNISQMCHNGFKWPFDPTNVRSEMKKMKI